MHEVLVNRLGGLSLPRKSVVRLTDRPDMTLDVYRGRKTTIQKKKKKKNLHVPAEDRTRDPLISSLALYHVALKAGLYRKAVQVYDIPNLYPVTFSPSILNLSSNSQKYMYKNHWK